MADYEKKGFDNLAMTGGNSAPPQAPGYGQPPQYGVPPGSQAPPYAAHTQYSGQYAAPPSATHSQYSGQYAAPPSATHTQYSGQYAPPPNVTHQPYGGPPVIVTAQPIRETGTPPETGCSLAVSILSIFLCIGAWPFAVVAIVFNRKANGLVRQGQYTAARGSLKTMYIFLVVTFVLGIILWVIAAIRIKNTIDAYNQLKEHRYYG